VQWEHNHNHIIGYDDANQLFCSGIQRALLALCSQIRYIWPLSFGLAGVVLFYQTCMVNIPPVQHFVCFDSINWICTFFKTFWFYIAMTAAYNPPALN
jgi:hypothetical protein